MNNIVPKSIRTGNCNSTLFYHLKKPLYHLCHTILQYFQHPKTLLFYHFIKILFFKSRGKHKKHFFLFVLSHFFHSFLSLSCLTSLLLIWVWLSFGLCSDCGSWFVDREFVMWVFVGCDPVGFCWLWCSSGFLLVMGVRFVGLAMLDGVAVGLAVGCGCHCQCGQGPSVVVVVLVSLLGLLSSNGGSVSGYSGGLVSDL